jgi:small subunit ribosomal protein S17
MTMAAPTSKAPERTAARKTRVGVVTSNKMQKTIVVRVADLVSHEKYSRVMGRANSFKVHDETNSAAIGDLVRIMETRPLSKDKRWRLVEIVHKASQAPAVPGSEEETAKPGRASS